MLQFIPWIRHLPLKRALDVKAARRAISEAATKLVREKEASVGEGKDILSLMISENENAKAEGQMAELELVDQVMTFLLAGHETTSTAVSTASDGADFRYLGGCIFFPNGRRFRIDCARRLLISKILRWKIWNILVTSTTSAKKSSASFRLVPSVHSKSNL
jgi:Cytochrome P450